MSHLEVLAIVLAIMAALRLSVWLIGWALDWTVRNQPPRTRPERAEPISLDLPRPRCAASTAMAATRISTHRKSEPRPAATDGVRTIKGANQ